MSWLGRRWRRLSGRRLYASTAFFARYFVNPPVRTQIWGLGLKQLGQTLVGKGSGASQCSLTFPQLDFPLTLFGHLLEAMLQAHRL